MKMFFAWLCVAVGVASLGLLVWSAIDSRKEMKSFSDFLFDWIVGSSDIFMLLFLSTVFAYLLFSGAI